MSGLEARLKEDLKARRLRFAYAAARLQKEPVPAPAKASAPQQWLSAEPFYPNMWFWDLVSWDGTPTPPAPRKLMIKDIQIEVCKDFGISLIDMKSPRREAKVVLPRMIAMYLCRALLEKSLPEIGLHFGGRDHTTVLSAVRKIEALLKRDPVFAESVQKFQARFT